MLIATCATSITTLGAARRRSVGAMGPSRSRCVEGSIVTTYSIVTSFSVKRWLYSIRAQALRPGLPRRQVARAGRRPLDPLARARPPAGGAALPGLPAEPAGDPAQHPLGSAEADGGARPGHAQLLLRPSATGGVRADRQGPRARRGRGRAGIVGLPSCPPSDGAGPRRLRPSGGDQVLLSSVRRACARRERRAAAATRLGQD